MPEPESEKRKRTDDDHQQPRKAPARKRASVACEECRARKRKCDGGMPACGGCEKRASECIYPSEARAFEWHQNMIHLLKARLEQLEGRNESVANLQNLVPTTTSDVLHERQVRQSYTDPTGTDTEFQAENTDDDMSRPVDNASPQFLRPTPPASSDARRAPLRTMDLTEYSYDSGQSIAPSSIQPTMFDAFMKPFEVVAGKPATETTASSFASSIRSTTMPPKNANCVCDQYLDTLCCDMPLRRQADALVEIFFGRHNRMFPILHKGKFMKQYQWLWQFDTGLQSNQERACLQFCQQQSRLRIFPALLNAVFALGALFAYREPEHSIAKADSFFSKAWRFDLLEILDDEVGLEPIQLGLLMSLYLQSTERFSKCWNILGLTIRMAQNKGLQYDAVEARERGLVASCSPQLEREMRARLWYICVLLDTEIALSFGQPSMITATSKSVGLPSPIDDEFLSEEIGKAITQPRSTPSLLETYIQTIKLYHLLKQVAGPADASTNGVKFAMSKIQNISKLHDQIMDWRRELPAHLEFGLIGENGEAARDETIAEISGNPREPLGLADLSRRLFCRYLYTVQLALRPALEQLFERQHQSQPDVREKTMETGLEELMLRDMASKCVLTAVQLNNFLSNQIQCQGFACWWYNISYTQTCGSTILMGQLCQLDEVTMPSSSLASSWTSCLENLARYSNISGIARKCHNLLQENAKRFMTKTQREKPKSTTPVWRPQQTSGRTPLPPTNQYSARIAPNTMTESLPASTAQYFPFPGPVTRNIYPRTMEAAEECSIYPDAELDTQFFDAMNNDLGDLDPSNSLPWPALPYLSQLESGLLDFMN